MTKSGGTFLEEVMKTKQFLNRWIDMVMRIVIGGKVCVKINGERSNFFKTFKGLMLGDPLLPLLFNLVADALSVLLDKGVEKGHISGVLGDLVPGGISHIQYADDTVITIDGSDRSILNLKLILYCFEWMSGLKIKFHKCEVFVFGAVQQERERMVNMLNSTL
jgi:hypothetical protein